MQGYAQKICPTRFFVGLRIEVDAPGVLAAIRPWVLYGQIVFVRCINALTLKEGVCPRVRRCVDIMVKI